MVLQCLTPALGSPREVERVTITENPNLYDFVSRESKLLTITLSALRLLRHHNWSELEAHKAG